MEDLPQASQIYSAQAPTLYLTLSKLCTNHTHVGHAEHSLVEGSHIAGPRCAIRQVAQVAESYSMLASAAQVMLFTTINIPGSQHSRQHYLVSEANRMSQMSTC